MPKFIFIFSALIYLLGLSSTGVAQPDSDLEIRAVPAQVKITGENPEPAQLFFQNRSQKNHFRIRLDWFSNTGYQPQFADPLNFELAPGRSKSLPFQISYQQEGALDGTLYFKITSTRITPGVPEVWESQSTVAIDLSATNLTDVAKMAQVEIQTTADALDEHRGGVIYLIIRNQATIPIQIEAIETFHPPFLTCAGAGENLPLRLEPRETGIFEIPLKITDVVQPGKYLVLFKVKLAWQIAGKTFRENLTARHTVNVGVFGESVILTLLAVPSFLILPGFLILTTIILLWRIGLFRTREIIAEFPIKASTAEFWLIGIFLSFVIAWLYPLLTGRNYLSGYNLQDIVRIWVLSLVLGLVLYVLIIEFLKVRHRWYTPNELDSPLDILKKIHRARLGLKLEGVELTANNQKLRAFLIEPRYENQKTIWIAPPILVEIPENADLTDQKNLEEKLRNDAEPAEMARFLKAGKARGSFKIYWKKAENLGGPRQEKIENMSFQKPAWLIESKLAD